MIPEFGIKRENEQRRDGGCAIIFNVESGKFAVGKHHEDGRLRLFSGGVDEGEDIVKGILREVEEESGLTSFKHIEVIAEAMTHYHNILKNVNRYGKATCLLLIADGIEAKDTQLEEHEKFSLTWVTKEELIEAWEKVNQNHDNDHWVYFLDKTLNRLKELGYNL